MIKLLTYSAGKEYREAQVRLVNHAMGLKTVDTTFEATREMLEQTEFYQENKVILDYKRGSGCWLWKSYYIFETLLTMEENEILIYLDSGDWISASFRTFLEDKMQNTNVLLTDGGYKHSDYCKRDAFVLMGCDSYLYYNAIQCEAGIIVCKKTQWTLNFISEWIHYCKMPAAITDHPNTLGENLPGFIDGRHDQAILTCLKLKHELQTSFEMRRYINCNKNL